MKPWNDRLGQIAVLESPRQQATVTTIVIQDKGQNAACYISAGCACDSNVPKCSCDVDCRCNNKSTERCSCEYNIGPLE